MNDSQATYAAALRAAKLLAEAIDLATYQQVVALAQLADTTYDDLRDAVRLVQDVVIGPEAVR
jgi:hypothetical protein